MSQDLFLANTLTVSTRRTPTGLVTTLKSGGRPVQATSALLDAAQSIAAGRPVDPEQRQLLIDAGILAPTNPFKDGMPPVLALRETVRVGLELAPASTSLPGLQGASFGPTQRLFESLFIPAFRLAPLLAFYNRLLHLWSHLIVRPDGREALARIAQEMLDEDYNLQAVMTDQGEPGAPHFQAVVALHEGTPQFDLRAVVLQNYDLEPVRVDVTDWAELPEVLRPLRALAAGVGGHDLRKVTTDAMVHPFREWLAEDLLFPPPKAELRLDDGYVAHLGHGTLLGTLGGARFAVDPWLPRASLRSGPIPLPRFALPALDALFLTSLDVDLADVETLMLLPEDTPIYVPEQPSAAVLETLGFTDVRTFTPGETFEIGDLRATSLPVDHPFGAGWLLHDGQRGFVALGRNSATKLDISPANTSPLFGSRVSSAAPRLMLGWPVLFEPADRWFEPAIPLPDLSELAGVLEPAEIVLYCEGGGTWYDRRTPAIRLSPDPATAPLGAILDDPSTLTEKWGRPVRISAPYDVYEIGAGFERSIVAAFTRP